MDAEEQLLYVVGRRTGVFARLADMDDPKVRAAAEQRRAAHRVTLANIRCVQRRSCRGLSRGERGQEGPGPKYDSPTACWSLLRISTMARVSSRRG